MARIRLLLLAHALPLPVLSFADASADADALFKKTANLYKQGQPDSAVSLLEQALAASRSRHRRARGSGPFSPRALAGREHEGTEDGYLTTREIAGLKLNADFVNLSACETGMGRILAGEGVVGLSEAFLTAGANSLSVSLWQVSDQGTQKFMTELYRAVRERGLSHARAMTEVKRSFLRAGPFTEPFYWAPFVYHGS